LLLLLPFYFCVQFVFVFFFAKKQTTKKTRNLLFERER
jgi:hypothetical protein